jgi:hypothetical protein
MQTVIRNVIKTQPGVKFTLRTEKRNEYKKGTREKTAAPFLRS